MSAIRDSLVQYVAARRALGATFYEPALALNHFVDMIEREGAEFITTDLVLRWAMESTLVQRATWGRRLSQARGFAKWMSVIDIRNEIPPSRLLSTRRRRNAPHIYTEQEIDLLMTQAARLRSRTGMRAQTYSTLIGLLVATGLRPSEAIWLDQSDVDLVNGVLSIRESKFGKSRFVPIEESTCAALERYTQCRDQLCLLRLSEAFLIGERGMRLNACTARSMFARLSACGQRRSMGAMVADRVFRISGTVLRRGGWSNGIEPGWMSPGNCRSFPPTLVTSMLASPIGISKRFPSCLSLRPAISARVVRESCHERGRSSVARPALLYAALARAARP